VPKQFLAAYGADAQIDAVEIDPKIIELGRKYFKMEDASVTPTHPNFQVHADDARYWLATAGKTYDVIGMDAYHQPYIPFHHSRVLPAGQGAPVAQRCGGCQRRQDA